MLQEARIFNDSHVDPRRCQQVITKLLYLLTQGESFTKVLMRRGRTRQGEPRLRPAGAQRGGWRAALDVLPPPAVKLAAAARCALCP